MGRNHAGDKSEVQRKKVRWIELWKEYASVLLNPISTLTSISHNPSRHVELIVKVHKETPLSSQIICLILDSHEDDGANKCCSSLQPLHDSLRLRPAALHWPHMSRCLP